MVPSKYFGAFAPGYHNSRSAPAARVTNRAARDVVGLDARATTGRAIIACLAASIFDIEDVSCVWCG